MATTPILQRKTFWKKAFGRFSGFDAPGDSERRQHVRYACDFPVTVKYVLADTEHVVTATARDISVGGMLLEGADVPDSVIRLHVSFELPPDILQSEKIERAVHVSAVVRYRDPRKNVLSLAFAEPLHGLPQHRFWASQGMFLISLLPIILLVPLAWFFDALAKYLVVWTVGYVVTLTLTPVVGWLARRVGAVDKPDARRPHTQTTPRGGGLAVVLGFFAAALVVFHVPWEWSAGSLDKVWLHNFLMGAGVLVLVGLLDDVFGLKASVKLLGQCVAAAIMFAVGNGMGLFLGFDLPLWADFLLTLLWFLALTNAFNLIDGLDGLATGLAIIAGFGLIGAFFIRRMPSDALVMIALASACMAFLRYNFHPASIFLGDTGSMFLGFTFASIALATGSKGAFLTSIGVPLLAVGIPVFDTMLAIWRRSVRAITRREDGAPTPSKGLMQPDVEHLHHRLRRRGMSQYQIAVLLYVINGFLVLTALASLAFRNQALGVFLLAFVVGAFVLMRHLADVELWDTSRAIIRGLTRPQAKVAAFLFYPISDVVFLVLALGGAIVVLQIIQPAAAPWEQWITAIPLWVAPSFLVFCSTRLYSRVWSLARSTDYLLLSVALSAGAIISLGLSLLLYPAEWRRYLVMSFIFTGLANLFLMGGRLIYRGLLDGISIWSEAQYYRSGGIVRRLLLYGAAERSLQYLREHKMYSYGTSSRRMVVGLVDDDTNLRFRRLGGYVVMGTGADIPALVERLRVDEIVVASPLPEEQLKALMVVCGERDVALSEWHYEERVIEVGSQSNPAAS